MMEKENLPAACAVDFKRLARTLIHGPAFQWALADAPDPVVRDQVMQALDRTVDSAGLRVHCLRLDDSMLDVSDLEARLVQISEQAEVIHLLGAGDWLSASRWEALNVRRERLAHGARARMVVWLDAQTIALGSEKAPDLWAWRAGVYVFTG